MGRQVIFLSCILFLLLSAILLKSCNTGEEKKEAVNTPVNNSSIIYTGSNACQSCHTKEFNDWKLSDHYLAMQHAHDSTVLGDFNNTTFKADGITSTFFKRDGKYFINTQGDDGNNHDYEVLYVFGYFPLQQYLIAFPGGRLQATRVSVRINGLINMPDKLFTTKTGCIGPAMDKTGIPCVPPVILPTCKKTISLVRIVMPPHGKILM